MAQKPNIVLVHGAWADGSSWSKVIAILKKNEYNVVATQHALISLADDTETTRRVAEAQEGPTILVGHSYGGAVITEAAGNCPNVIGLVYVAAFAPNVGESLNSLAAGAPPPPGFTAVRPDKYGMLWLDKNLFAENFCQDVEPEEAEVMAATQQPIAARCFDDKVTNAGWQKLPCWYQISAQDRMIPPPAQQFMGERIKAKIVFLPSSHTPMVSHPEEIADIIMQGAKAAVEAMAFVADME
ncbi:MAG: alpha/beta hydrolase [Chitinophagaceae bacterium]